MRQFITVLLLSLANPLLAEEAIVFKKELISTFHWFPYSIILIVLIIAVLVLAKNSKKIIKTHSSCKVIESIAIHHKTKVHVIDYQGQKFLLADNQHSLAIHALQENIPS
jgi:flagellar biogenesis protein FliO